MTGPAASRARNKAAFQNNCWRDKLQYRENGSKRRMSNSSSTSPYIATFSSQKRKGKQKGSSKLLPIFCKPAHLVNAVATSRRWSRSSKPSSRWRNITGTSSVTKNSIIFSMTSAKLFAQMKTSSSSLRRLTWNRSQSRQIFLNFRTTFTLTFSPSHPTCSMFSITAQPTPGQFASEIDCHSLSIYLLLPLGVEAGPPSTSPIKDPLDKNYT